MTKNIAWSRIQLFGITSVGQTTEIFKKHEKSSKSTKYLLKAASRGVLGDEVAPPFGTIVTFGRVRNFETTRL